MEFDQSAFIRVIENMAAFTKDEDLNISLLVVLEPLIPIIYRQQAKEAVTQVTLHHDDGKVVTKDAATTRREVDDKSSFLEAFTFIEFYIDQLLKLLFSPSFSALEWHRLDYLLTKTPLRLEDKLKLISVFDKDLWARIGINIKPLQKLRNSMTHSPVGPYAYKGKEIKWQVVDKDLVSVENRILTEYKAVQKPILEQLIATDSKDMPDVQVLTP